MRPSLTVYRAIDDVYISPERQWTEGMRGRREDASSPPSRFAMRLLIAIPEAHTGDSDVCSVKRPCYLCENVLVHQPCQTVRPYTLWRSHSPYCCRVRVARYCCCCPTLMREPTTRRTGRCALLNTSEGRRKRRTRQSMTPSR